MQSVTNGVSPLEGGGSLRGKAFGMSTTDFPRIDRDRLRTRARRLDRWALLALFDRAVEHGGCPRRCGISAGDQQVA